MSLRPALLGALLLLPALLAGCTLPSETGAAADDMQPLESSSSPPQTTAAREDVIVTALTLDLARVAAGERFHLSVDLRNVADEPRTGALEVLVDGEAHAARAFIAPPGEATTLVIPITLETPGDHTLTIRTQDALDLSYPVLVRVEPPARFLIEMVSVMPHIMDLGDSVRITASVINHGEREGIAEVRLEVDGRSVGTRAIALGPGATGELALLAQPETAGEVQVSARLTSGSSVSSTPLIVRAPSLVEPREELGAYSICQEYVPYFLHYENTGTGSAREALAIVTTYDAGGAVVDHQEVALGEVKPGEHMEEIHLRLTTRCPTPAEYVVAARIVPKWGEPLAFPTRTFTA